MSELETCGYCQLDRDECAHAALWREIVACRAQVARLDRPRARESESWPRALFAVLVTLAAIVAWGLLVLMLAPRGAAPGLP